MPAVWEAACPPGPVWRLWLPGSGERGPVEGLADLLECILGLLVAQRAAQRVYPDGPVIPAEGALRMRNQRRLRALGLARVHGPECRSNPWTSARQVSL